jgi:hypothetical protein
MDGQGVMVNDTYNIDRPGIPVFRGKLGKALYDVGPVLAPNFVPTCGVIATMPAARPRLVDDDHADIKRVSRMCAQRLDDGGLRQRSRICREEDRRGVQDRPKWNDCFILFLRYSSFLFQ